MPSKAIVLLSGGLDSATTLAIAKDKGRQCYALSFAYGQRHDSELQSARRIAEDLAVEQHRIFDLNLVPFSDSSLTNRHADILASSDQKIPSTYVPARNTIFLSLALAWAEVLECLEIYIGVNAIDYSGYPDCRPEYIEAFQKMAGLATRDGVSGKACQIITPLINLTKDQIIRTGIALGLDYTMTVSCYQADAQGRACGVCDSCRLRKQGFANANIPDATRYID